MTLMADTARSDEFTLTANTVASVSLSGLFNRLYIFHTGLASDAKLRVTVGDLATAPSDPSSSFTAEADGFMRALSAEGNSIQPTIISFKRRTSQCKFRCDQNVTLVVSFENSTSEKNQ